jgi:AcrR family transcriptional regulator
MRASKTKTEIRQDQIATAALELMARHGPKALNVAALARRVGVVPSAIYRHYPGKEAVLDAVLDLIAQKLRNNVEAVRQEVPDPLDRLHRLLNRHVQLIENHVVLPRIMLSEEIFNDSATRRQQVHRIIQGYLDKVAELVSDGQREGSVRADLPSNTVSVMFLGLIQPAVILWLLSDGAFNVAAHGERAWQIFRETIQAHGSSDVPAKTRAVSHGNKRKAKQT